MKEEVAYHWTREVGDEGLIVTSNHDGTVCLHGCSVPWSIDFHAGDIPALRELVDTLEAARSPKEGRNCGVSDDRDHISELSRERQKGLHK